jgi:hypothetical protein
MVLSAIAYFAGSSPFGTRVQRGAVFTSLFGVVAQYTEAYDCSISGIRLLALSLISGDTISMMLFW